MAKLKRRDWVVIGVGVLGLVAGAVGLDIPAGAQSAIVDLVCGVVSC